LLLLASCSEVGADGFLASVDLQCPAGYIQSEGRCYRNSPAGGGEAGVQPRVDAGSMDLRAGMPAGGRDAAAGGRGGGEGNPPAGGSGGGAGSGGAMDAADLTPAACPTPRCLTASVIAVGALHTCALLSDGRVQCWGDNGSGALGVPPALPRSPVPVAVPALAGVMELSAGDGFTCALLGNGTMRCWGESRSGQLGDGSPPGTVRPMPGPVAGLQGVSAIASAGNHTCAVVGGGEVACWGSNADGQLGDGTYGEEASRATPVRVSGVTGATAVAVGASHSCALVGGGAVRCWGLNSAGQLGSLGTTDEYRSLSPVTVADLRGASAISAGAGYTCALVAGAVRCWGGHGYGPPTDGGVGNAWQHLAAPGLSGAVSVAAGRHHGCAALSDGSVHCWGEPRSNGTSIHSRVPVALPGLAGVTALAASASHTCALTSAGWVQCWGYNGSGQLGRGNYDSLPLGPAPPVAAAM
jgi:alpha-tubulin suppressor-like RCC1 family protein